MKVSDIPVVAGWKLLPDYAEPATAGGGYCEVQDNGDFEIAYEADASMREMGVDSFLLTFVPAEVIRALLASYDAGSAAKCVLCGAKCTAQDYCNGCSSHVCDGCDNPDADKRPQGEEHEPAAHRVAS